MLYQYSWVVPEQWATTPPSLKGKITLVVRNLIYQRNTSPNTDIACTFTWNDGSEMLVGADYTSTPQKAAGLYVPKGEQRTFNIGYVRQAPPEGGLGSNGVWGSFSISVTANSTVNSPQSLAGIQRPEIPEFVSPVYFIVVATEDGSSNTFTVTGGGGVDWPVTS